jgi:hypothetical protein
LVADFCHLIRAKPGYDGCPRDRIQGVELIMDVLHGQLGYLALVAKLDRRSGQEHGCHHQQPCPDDSWAHSVLLAIASSGLQADRAVEPRRHETPFPARKVPRGFFPRRRDLNLSRSWLVDGIPGFLLAWSAGRPCHWAGPLSRRVQVAVSQSS